MNRFRRIFTMILVVAMAIGGALGLSEGAAAAVTIAFGGDKDLHIYLPVLIAEELGFFEDEGVTVTLRSYQGGNEAKQAVLSGEADVAASFYTNVVLGAAAGEDLVSFFTLLRYPGWVVVAGPAAAPMTGLHELAGRTVGVSSIDSGTYAFARYLMAREGLFEDDVTFREIGTGPAAVAALADGTVHVAVLYEPSAGEALQDIPGAVALVDTGRMETVQALFGSDMVPGSTLYTTGAWLAERPDTARRVAAAVQRALAAIKHLTVAEIVERYEDDGGVMVETRREADGEAGGLHRMFSPDGTMTAAGAEATWDLLAAAYDDWAPGGVDLKSTYTNDFVH